jgi:hypothetical protein
MATQKPSLSVISLSVVATAPWLQSSGYINDEEREEAIRLTPRTPRWPAELTSSSSASQHKQGSQPHHFFLESRS